MLTHVSLLQLQRDLYNIPAGRERFDAYIAELRDADGEMRLPLPAMNPMAKEHVPALLDEYLELGADEIAQTIIAGLQPTIPFGKDEYRTALVLADDEKGQWTNRVATDFSHRFKSRPMFRRNWLVGLLWSSERASDLAVKNAIRLTIYRGLWIAEHGFAETLEQMLAQEGFAQMRAGFSPTFDAEEIEYTAEVLSPILQNDDEPTLVAALYGDPAAAELGHPKLGLSPNAGFELALVHSIRQKG